jgi:hypothetical protein
MARRRSGQPAISLFSFQDIVTSVTAILILLVLIMTLELIARKCREAAGSVTHVREGLEGSVQELEAVEERLSRLVPQSQPTRLRPTLAALEHDERVLEQQVEWAEERRDEAEQVRNAAEELLAGAKIDLREAERTAADRMEELAAEAAATRDRLRESERAAVADEGRAAKLEQEAGELHQANAKQRERVDQRQQEVDEMPRTGTELVFRRPANQERQPWLLEVSRTGFAAVRLGTGKVRRLGEGSGPGSVFSGWLGGLAAGNDYVLILVRPSGVPLADEAKEALQSRNITFGLDFIGEDQAVHDAAGPRREGGSPDAEEPPS